MQMRAAILAAIAIAAGSYAAVVSASYFADISICPTQFRVIGDKDRIDAALARVDELSTHYPDYKVVDRSNCCRVAKERVGGDYAVTFHSIATMRWNSLVGVRYGPHGSKEAFFPITQCGAVAEES